jgi:hypothetical protein
MVKKSPLSLKEIQDSLHKHEREMRIEFETLTKLEKDVLAKTVKLQEEGGVMSTALLIILLIPYYRKMFLPAETQNNQV